MSEQTVLTALVVALAVAVYCAWAYRRRARTWEAKANYWFGEWTVLDHYRTEAEWRKGIDPALAKLSPSQVEKPWTDIRDGFPDELPPAHLPLGTRANPILTPNGDSARFSTLDELTGGSK